MSTSAETKAQSWPGTSSQLASGAVALWKSALTQAQMLAWAESVRRL